MGNIRRPPHVHVSSSRGRPLVERRPRHHARLSLFDPPAARSADRSRVFLPGLVHRQCQTLHVRGQRDQPGRSGGSGAESAAKRAQHGSRRGASGQVGAYRRAKRRPTASRAAIECSSSASTATIANSARPTNATRCRRASSPAGRCCSIFAKWASARSTIARWRFVSTTQRRIFSSCCRSIRFAPVHHGCLERYGTPAWKRPENIVTNGAFRLFERRIRDRIRLVRSENYWDRDNVRLQRDRRALDRRPHHRLESVPDRQMRLDDAAAAQRDPSSCWPAARRATTSTLTHN